MLKQRLKSKLRQNGEEVDSELSDDNYSLGPSNNPKSYYKRAPASRNRSYGSASKSKKSSHLNLDTAEMFSQMHLMAKEVKKQSLSLERSVKSESEKVMELLRFDKGAIIRELKVCDEKLKVHVPIFKDPMILDPLKVGKYSTHNLIVNRDTPKYYYIPTRVRIDDDQVGSLFTNNPW